MAQNECNRCVSVCFSGFWLVWMHSHHGREVKRLYFFFRSSLKWNFFVYIRVYAAKEKNKKLRPFLRSIRSIDASCPMPFLCGARDIDDNTMGFLLLLLLLLFVFPFLRAPGVVAAFSISIETQIAIELVSKWMKSEKSHMTECEFYFFIVSHSNKTSSGSAHNRVTHVSVVLSNFPFFSFVSDQVFCRATYNIPVSSFHFLFFTLIFI